MRWLAGLLGLGLLALPVHAGEGPDVDMLIFLGEMVEVDGEWLGPDEADTLAALSDSAVEASGEVTKVSEDGRPVQPSSGEADQDD